MLEAAFFDMDWTLLRCNTGTEWVRYLRRRGEISRLQLWRALGWILQYKFAVLDFDAVTRRVVADMAGDPEAELREKCQRWVEQEVVPAVFPRARERIAEHKRRGHLCAILSSSSPYVTEPLARALDLDAVLCTRLEVDSGRFTGRVLPPVCFGPGKVAWAERLAAEHTIDLGSSWFYTDSYSDLPMLQRVGRQVVVNPDPRLRRFARRVGWAVEQW
jgi:HAD superfamily hydrolase (TIGR01490 family)